MKTEEFDICSSLKGASVQFGPNSDRVYLMSMQQGSPSVLAKAMRQLAKEQMLGKLIAKVRQSDAEPFLQQGFVEEACLPGYFGSHGLGGGEDALLLAAYPDSQRQYESGSADYDRVLELATMNITPFVPNRNWQIIPLDQGHVHEMAHLYREVFPTYPFPIYDGEYLRQMMAKNVRYYGIKFQSRLVALASAEQDAENLAVEMTDFATLPEFRGQHLAGSLLATMESEMQQSGYQLAYTIARAASVSMNRTFARQGYEYQGRLINNTQISGNLESMNIWSKVL
ncbi:MAG: putative beta-lysine N-acetyltransferase [Shewanella sp.]|nr:putative beta-lysine N-acetyltransferase [Shewanella sp.]MCF1430045.1 putative beta-lysine N-acetyltransferase [Shewanella sp.]MCF1458862.1 putative beta-lysine N-acetyltransferase [Shewanella sp.]